jgi:putative membrane protein
MDDSPEIKPLDHRDQVHLAMERTYLAYERTLMAWVRTATSLIAFGFTLYQFFFYLNLREPVPRARQLLGPRTFGLAMIGIGVIALAIATWQHRRNMIGLREHYRDAPFSLALVVAALIAILGILGFAAAIFHE